jgi:hypothetical protein
MINHRLVSQMMVARPATNEWKRSTDTSVGWERLGGGWIQAERLWCAHPRPLKDSLHATTPCQLAVSRIGAALKTSK